MTGGEVLGRIWEYSPSPPISPFGKIEDLPLYAKRIEGEKYKNT
jgi:hypothetical protein